MWVSVKVLAGIGALVLSIVGVYRPETIEWTFGVLGFVPERQIAVLKEKLDKAEADLVASEAKQKIRMAGDPMVWMAKGVGLAITAEQCVKDALNVLQEQGYENVQHRDPESQLPYYVYGRFWENASPASVLVDCYGDRLGMLFPSVAIAVKKGDDASGKERVVKIRDALVAKARQLSPEEVTIKR